MWRVMEPQRGGRKTRVNNGKLWAKWNHCRRKSFAKKTPKSSPGSRPPGGGTGAPGRCPSARTRIRTRAARRAGGAQSPAAPADGSVAPPAPLTARPPPVAKVSLGSPHFSSFLDNAVCGVRLSIQPVLGGGAGGVAAGRMSQTGHWEILALVGLDSAPCPGMGLGGEMGDGAVGTMKGEGGTPEESLGSF